MADAPPAPDAAFAFAASATAQMERLLADLGRVYRERNTALHDLEQSHLETLMRLAVAAELRDGDTGVHILRLGYLAEALARDLGCRPGGPPPAPGRAHARHRQDRHRRRRAQKGDSSPRGAPADVRAPADGRRHPRPPNIPLSSWPPRWPCTTTNAGTAAATRLPQGAEIPLSGRIVAVVDFFDALTAGPLPPGL